MMNRTHFIEAAAVAGSLSKQPRHALVIQEVSWISQKVSRRSQQQQQPLHSQQSFSCLTELSGCLFTSFSNCHFDDAIARCCCCHHACHFNSLCFPTSRRAVIVFQYPKLTTVYKGFFKKETIHPDRDYYSENPRKHIKTEVQILYLFKKVFSGEFEFISNDEGGGFPHNHFRDFKQGSITHLDLRISIYKFGYKKSPPVENRSELNVIDHNASSRACQASLYLL